MFFSIITSFCFPYIAASGFLSTSRTCRDSFHINVKSPRRSRHAFPFVDKDSVFRKLRHSLSSAQTTFSSFSRWNRYSLIDTPSESHNPQLKETIPNACRLGDLCYRHIPPSEIHNGTTSSISRLFFCGRPSAVRRLVVSVIVNSLNAEVGSRRIAHVVIERRE